MSECKPVTGELRAYLEAHQFCRPKNQTELVLSKSGRVRLNNLLDAIDALHANLEDENGRLQSEVVRVASDLADKELERHTLRNRIVELQKGAETERKDLRNQVLACQRRSRDLDEEVRELRARLSRKVDKVEEQDRISNQRAELAKLNDAIARRNKEIELLRDEYASMRDGLMDENKALSEQIVDLQLRNGTLSRMLGGTHADLTARKRDRDYFADVAEVACDGVGTLSQAITAAIGEIDAVVAEIDEVLAELDEKEKA